MAVQALRQAQLERRLRCGALVRTVHPVASMLELPPGTRAAHEAAAASLRVVESAVALARAEAKLLVARASGSLRDALLMAVGVLVTISFVELAVVLVALTPLLLTAAGGERFAPHRGAPWALLSSLAISIGVAAVGALVSKSAWKRLKNGEETRAERGQS